MSRQSEPVQPVEGSTKTLPPFLVRASFVFNAAQVEGWHPDEESDTDRTDKLLEADLFLASLGAHLEHGGDRAYYQKRTDAIHMPLRSSFTGTDWSSPTESYYAVLLHEHVHWTGHPDRLARDLSGSFGSHAYAMEELVAELGAAFLCADLGIANEPRRDHALYLKSWLPVLREKKLAFVQATKAAMQACLYLRERSKAALTDP